MQTETTIWQQSELQRVTLQTGEWMVHLLYHWLKPVADAHINPNWFVVLSNSPSRSGKHYICIIGFKKSSPKVFEENYNDDHNNYHHYNNSKNAIYNADNGNDYGDNNNKPIT